MILSLHKNAGVPIQFPCSIIKDLSITDQDLTRCLPHHHDYNFVIFSKYMNGFVKVLQDVIPLK